MRTCNDALRCILHSWVLTLMLSQREEEKRIYIYIYICTYVCTARLCMYVCMYVCMDVCMYIIHMYYFMYIDRHRSTFIHAQTFFKAYVNIHIYI